MEVFLKDQEMGPSTDHFLWSAVRNLRLKGKDVKTLALLEKKSE